jgi:DNA polymerase-3 subunit alpha
MRVVEIDDGSARLEVTVFSELFDATKGLLRVDEPLVVSARIDNDEYSGGLRGSAVEILSLGQARLRYARGLMVCVKSDRAWAKAETDHLVSRLRAALTPLEGGGGIRVLLGLDDGRQACELVLGDGFRVRPDPEQIQRIGEALGQDARVLIRYD